MILPLQKPTNKKQGTELSIKKKREIKLKYLTSIRLFNDSHKLFQKDTKGNVTEADFMYDEGQTIKWEEIIKEDFSKLSKRLLYREGYKYCSALNKKNAIKRFKEMDKKGIDFLGREFEPVLDLI